MSQPINEALRGNLRTAALVTELLAATPISPNGEVCVGYHEHGHGPHGFSPVWGEPRPIARAQAAAVLREHALWLRRWFGADHPAALATQQRADAITEADR